MKGKPEFQWWKNPAKRRALCPGDFRKGLLVALVWKLHCHSISRAMEVAGSKRTAGSLKELLPEIVSSAAVLRIVLTVVITLEIKPVEVFRKTVPSEGIKPPCFRIK